MENKKVKIVNMTNGPISVKIPAASLQREWMSHGASVNVDSDKLEEMMYDIGFKYMIDTGMLYIEDMDVKINLGIEPEGATAPVNVIVLSEADKKRYMTAMPIKEFKIQIAKLNREQLGLLCDYAIANKYTDFEKAKALKEHTGRDIIQTIRLSEQNKED